MKIIPIILLILLSFIVNSQIIHPSRTADWSNSGYPGTIPNPSTILNVADFGAVGDSMTDNTTAIISAIDSLHGSRGVIYFPPGNYIIGSTIDLPDSVIIRGSGNDSTHLLFNLNNVAGNCFNITGSVSGVFTEVVSGADRGSSSMVVADATGLSIDDFAELIQDNGSWDTQPVFWADNSVGQILRITDIIGDTIFFDAPLRINYDTTLNARIQNITPATEVGIECLEITRLDTVSTGVCYAFHFNFAANCWMRGVESAYSIGSHVEIDASTNISIRGCYFHHSYYYDGVSTHGYGITLFAHTGQCRIENNIMQHLRHAFSFQTGANGNVVAYNYSHDVFRTEFPSDLSADVSFHGHFPFSNLVEGNIVNNIQIDYTHGPSGPFNTFFRNRAEEYGIYMTAGSYQSDSMNFVGNEVPNMNTFMGNYTLTGSQHFEFANNVRGNIIPSGTGPLPDSSYFLTGLPNYWTSTDFPTIGMPNALNTGSIPARDRFLSGHHLTDCDDDITIGIKETGKNHFEIYPNPASDRIFIRTLEEMKNYHVSIKDINGKFIQSETFSDSYTVNIIEINYELTNGIYLVEIVTDKIKFVKKVVLLGR